MAFTRIKCNIDWQQTSGMPPTFYVPSHELGSKVEFHMYNNGVRCPADFFGNDTSATYSWGIADGAQILVKDDQSDYLILRGVITQPISHESEKFKCTINRSEPNVNKHYYSQPFYIDVVDITQRT